jgi:hypothetical protein
MRETATARVMLRDDGVVVTRINAGAAQTLDDARANLAASIAATGGTRRPLLVDISRCLPLQPPVRHYYTGKLLTDAFNSLGLLIEATSFGRMMGNVYLRVARPGVPTQLFARRASAAKWLSKHVSL